MIKLSHDVSDGELASACRRQHEMALYKIFHAENESDVRQFFLRLLGLDLVGNLEKYRIDYVHPEIWLEFKFNANMGDRRCRVKIISQILHYLHYALVKRGEHLLPDSFGIVDKNFIMLYDTADFLGYICNNKYFEDIKSPSAPHPDLERALFADTRIESEMMNVLTEYEDIWIALEKRGAYDGI